MTLKNFFRCLPLALSLTVSAQTAGWSGGAFAPVGAASAVNRSVLDPNLAGAQNAPGMNAPGMNAPGAAPQSGAAAERASSDPRSTSLVPRPLPNQFQRFVQESSGRLLPIYGSELFNLSQAYAADTALSPSADYVLGVGDEVRIQVWGSVDYVGSHTIDRSGQISLPKVGRLHWLVCPCAIWNPFSRFS